MKVYTKDNKRQETDSILIKGKRERFLNVRQGV